MNAAGSAIQSCSSCGRQLPTIARFCTHCGTRVAQSASKFLNTSGFASNRATERSENRGEVTRGVIGSASSSSASHTARCVFIVGRQTNDEIVARLRSSYPGSQVHRFESTGVVRQLASRYSRTEEYDAICLLGGAVALPVEGGIKDLFAAGGVEDDGHPVESDLHYVLGRLPDAPGFRHANLQSTEMERIAARLTAHDGAKPLSICRIPSDDPEVWDAVLGRSLDSIEDTASYLSISAEESAWLWECSQALDGLALGGTKKTFSLPAMRDRLSETIRQGSGCQEGTRIVINLHGGEATEEGRQIFSPGYYEGILHEFDAMELAPFRSATVFLFACYGGQSGWWKNGFIREFFGGGGKAIVAASSPVWCASPEEGSPPFGAVDLCRRFFLAAEDGNTLVQSLNIAKLGAIQSAVDRGYAPGICKTIAEVLKFSLYGSPFARLAGDATTAVGGASSSRPNSVLERSRQRLAAGQSGRRATENLNRARSRLSLALGERAAYFRVNRDQAVTELRQAGIYERVAANLADHGAVMGQVEFEVVHLRDARYHLANFVPEGARSRAPELAILDSDGHLLRKYQAKGSA